MILRAMACFLPLAATMCAAETKQKICLNMIVKNESPVIERCLASVKPLIDHWVIVDTGSTDGTQQIIRTFMQGVQGELHERPWVDFSYNRNEAMALAKGKGDYLLFIDADEYWAVDAGYRLPLLDKDSYFALVHERASGVDYKRICLIDNHLDWRWEGVLHETIASSSARSHAVLPGVVSMSVSEEGSRSKDPKKYQKDAEVLENALLKEPNNSRYVFYLAQCYDCAGQRSLALKNYAKRAEMGGWDEEVFWSLYSVGLLQERLGTPPETIIESYCKAYQYRPSRAEPLYRLANHYFRAKNYLLAYIICKFALTIPLSQDSVFVEHAIYTHGLLIQLADSCHFLGKNQEAAQAFSTLLERPNVPAEVRELAEKNIAALGVSLTGQGTRK